MALNTDRQTLVFVVNVDWYFAMHWLERAVAAKNAGFDVVVVSNSAAGKADPRISEARILWIHWPASRYSVAPSKLYREFKSLKKILDRLQPDLIHSITIKPNLLCGAYAHTRKSGVRYVQTFPGMGSVLGGGGAAVGVKKKLVTFALRFGCKRADAFTFENTDDEQYFRRWILPPDAVVLISLGAGVDLGLYGYKENEFAKGEPFRILHAARLLKSKGLQELTEAVALLRKWGYGVTLSAAGIAEPDAPDAIESSWLIESESKGLLKLLGQVDDMPSLIPQFHMVALPTSYGEGIPRILIEAAAMGRCILATDVAGCRELIDDGKTGLLVGQAKPESIALALKTLLESPERVAELGAMARKHVEAGYGQETVIRQFLMLYHRLLEKPH